MKDNACVANQYSKAISLSEVVRYYTFPGPTAAIAKRRRQVWLSFDLPPGLTIVKLNGSSRKDSRLSLIRFVLITLLGALFVPLIISAQDSRSVSEPKFPTVCGTLRAPLESMPNGPAVPEDVTVQDEESSRETQLIDSAIDGCPQGHAVELALGSDLQHSAFLINPLAFPPGVSLIIDGGVTVYASRDPTNYQINDPIYNPQKEVCGTVGAKMLVGVCQAVLTFSGDPKNSNEARSGLYGYGVLDGQGQTIMLWPPGTGPASPTTWWDLRLQKHNNGDDVNENSPLMVAAGALPGTLANDLTLYKVTIRNPPFHTVHWGGDGLTVWGVRIQAPWDEPNTDGFDLHGTNATLYDTIVSNGDDDIAFAVNQSDTKNITVKHFSAYSRDGITLLGNGNGTYSISNLLFDDVTITGDLPSIDLAAGTVNGVSEDKLKADYNVSGYTRALPNANGDVHGLNIKYQSASSQTNVTFRNVCIRDVRTPLNIEADAAPTAATKVDNILYQNVHVLAPGRQYLNYDYGTGTADGPGSGRYIVHFGGVPGILIPQFTLYNVVLDDVHRTHDTSISSIVATGNDITTKRNIYPEILNHLDISNPPDIEGNTYSGRTFISTPELANPCSKSVPFITGELFATNGIAFATSDATNLYAFTTKAGSTISLNAVVQPIMSQTTYAVPGPKNDPQTNVVAIGSPALTNEVRFYDCLNYLGSATLSANGTLASLQIRNIRAGLHVFTAQYPKDRYYDTLNFGVVVLFAKPDAGANPR